MARRFLGGIDLLNQLVTAIGAQMSTGKLLGRSTAGSGAIEEISIGSGLSLSGGTLSATGGGGGGLTKFTEAESTSAPNATVYVDSLKAAGTSTDADVALVAKGAGATLAQVPDGTTAGGNKRGSGATDWQKTRNNISYVASGVDSVIGGGRHNTSSGLISTIGGGNTNSASGSESVISGGFGNSASSTWAAITGGSNNTASGQQSCVSGGAYNLASATSASVGGGLSNTASGQQSRIGGGASNSALGTSAFVGAGNANNVATNYSAVTGGFGNTITNATHSFIGGGYQNTANGNSFAVVCGGGSNNTSGQYGFTGGGQSNSALGSWSVVVGGLSNSVSDSYGFVSGGSYGTTRGIIGYHAFPACNAPIQTVQGCSQAGLLVLGRQTTSNTSTTLSSNSSTANASNQLYVEYNSAYSFTGQVIATVANGGDTARWQISGAIKRGGFGNPNVALVGTPVVTMTHNDAGAAGWVVAVTADTSRGCLSVTVTGAASTTIRWVCKIETTEVTF